MLEMVRHVVHKFGNDKTYYIALSGGLDSSVLCHICLRIRDELNIKLIAIHVNHGLNKDANQWLHDCRKWCDAVSLPMIDETLTIDLQPGQSLEEIARNKRYAIFAKYIIDENCMLLTAHQQNDQAETFLIQLLRGAGLKGLAAMPPVKSFAKGWHARPLLTCNRQDLERYAKEYDISWHEDSSNQDIHFARNYIRHHVLKNLMSRWPSAIKTITRSAHHCAEAEMLLQEFSEDYCMSMQGTRPHTLSVNKLKTLNNNKQKLILRTWIYKTGFPLPAASKCDAIIRDLFQARWDRIPFVEWHHCRVYRYRDDLYLRRIPEKINDHAGVIWDLAAPLQLTSSKSMHAISVLGKGLRANINKVVVRYRQGGEKVMIPGRGKQTLKNLFHEWQVLPWERESIPLLYLNDMLVAVVGYFYHSDYTSRDHEQGWEIIVSDA